MIIDTSVLISLLVTEDSNHQRAILDVQTDSSLFIVTDRVLEELVSTLTYKKDIEFALGALEQVQMNARFEFYSLTPAEAAGVFDWMKRVRRDLSFVDYSVAYLAKQRGEKLLSYDKQLLSLLKNGPESG